MGVMTHNTQLLIATERERWLNLHLHGGMTITELKNRSGFSRDTLHRWKREYLAHSLEGLKERSRAHRSHPRMTPYDVIEKIRELRSATPRPGAPRIALRLQKRYGVIMQWRSIHKVLVREKLVTRKKRLIAKDRWRPKTTVPGELIEIDVVYAKKYKGRWLYQFTAVDACTRWTFPWTTNEQSNRTAVLFLKKLMEAAPFSVRGVKTDNASIFTNYYTGYKKSADPTNPKRHIFDRVCAELGIAHYLIDPGKPAQNGKVERLHRTNREEFWRTVTFNNLAELRKKHAAYAAWYNGEREHFGIDGLTPLEKLEKCQT